MSTADDLRRLAESYEADAHGIRGMDKDIGYGLTNEQWATVYHTVATELYNARDVLEDA